MLWSIIYVILFWFLDLGINFPFISLLLLYPVSYDILCYHLYLLDHLLDFHEMLISNSIPWWSNMYMVSFQLLLFYYLLMFALWCLPNCFYLKVGFMNWLKEWIFCNCGMKCSVDIINSFDTDKLSFICWFFCLTNLFIMKIVCWYPLLYQSLCVPLDSLTVVLNRQVSWHWVHKCLLKSLLLVELIL